MENNRIMRVLAVILTVACLIVAGLLVSVRRDVAYVPEEAVDNLVEILASSGIVIDPDLVSTKRETGTVYVFDSDNYNRTVSELLSGSVVKDTYAVPDGELLVLENGDRCEYGSNFTFRYRAADADEFSPTIVDLRYYAERKTEAEAGTAAAAVRTFLGNGSRSFDGDRDLRVAVVIDEIWETEGIRYVLCSRTIDGVAITGNLVLCTVENGRVTAAYGTWCFFTPGTSYRAQLSDLLNILFNVKKELAPRMEGEDEPTTIRAVKSCYALYFFGEEENFCLIPCWQITTDRKGEFIYNAIDGALYTKTR